MKTSALVTITQGYVLSTPRYPCTLVWESGIMCALALKVGNSGSPVRLAFWRPNTRSSAKTSRFWNHFPELIFAASIDFFVSPKLFGSFHELLLYCTKQYFKLQRKPRVLEVSCIVFSVLLVTSSSGNRIDEKYTSQAHLGHSVHFSQVKFGIQIRSSVAKGNKDQTNVRFRRRSPQVHTQCLQPPTVSLVSSLSLSR